MALGRKVFWLFLIFLGLAVSAFAGTLAEEAMVKGQEYLDAGNYEEAITQFNSVIADDPKNAAAYYKRGLTHHKKDNLDKAISDYGKAIELNSKDPEYYYNRGIVYYYQDELDQAIEDWSKTIELNPDYPQAYQKRAFGYFKKEKYDLAWEDVRILKRSGYGIDPNFLEKLKSASGKKE